MTGALVLITRWGSDVGKNTDRRVYVTRRDFAPGVFSSTTDRAMATRFESAEAGRLVATKWRGLEPKIEAVDVPSGTVVS